MNDLTTLPGFLRYNDRSKHDYDMGEQWIFRFPNDYGASVISGSLFYTDKDHPYELGVVFFDGDKFNLVYPKEIGPDVLGYLTFDDVVATLKKIEELPYA